MRVDLGFHLENCPKGGGGGGGGGNWRNLDFKGGGGGMMVKHVSHLGVSRYS